MESENKERFKKYFLKETLDINTIYTVFYNTMVKNYTSSGESHDFYELIYVDNGQLMVEVEDKNENFSYTLLQGQAYLHYPNQFHRHYVKSKKSAAVCIISFECECNLMDILCNHPILLTKKQKEVMSEIMKYASCIFEKMSNDGISFVLVEYKNYNEIFQQLLKISLEKLFLDMAICAGIDNKTESSKSNLTNEDPLVGKILVYLSLNIYNKLSIEDLCKHFSYGKTTISARFRHCTGKTIMEYFNEMKIREATYIIEHTDLNMTDIASKLNFYTTQYFSKVFKQYIGMHPSHYKKSIVKEENVKYFISK